MSMQHSGSAVNRLDDITELLNSASVDWAYARTRQQIEADIEAGDRDLDIWCPADSLAPLLEPLLCQGWFICGGRQLGDPLSKPANCTVRLRNSRTNNPLLEISAGALRWNAVFYLEESDAGRHIERQSGLPFLGGSALLAVYVTRVALRGALCGSRLQQARELYCASTQSTREQWRAQCGAVLGDVLCRKLASLLESEAAGGFSNHARLLQFRTLLRQQGAFLRLLRRIPHLLAARLRNWLPIQAGVICCVFGTDGAGKTTLTERLRAQLRDENLRVSYAYLGRAKGNTRFIGALRRKVLRILGMTEEDAPQAAGEQEKPPGRKVPPAVLNLAALIYWLEYWWRYAGLMLTARRRCVVMLDRYGYDLQVMPGVHAMVRKLVAWLPHPDIVIFSDADAAAIYARKPERTLEEIKRQQTIYRSIYRQRRMRGVALCVHAIPGKLDDNICHVAALVHAMGGYREGATDLRVVTELAGHLDAPGLQARSCD